jgi:hypothetical protein
MFKLRRVTRFTITIVCFFSLASLVKFYFHDSTQIPHSPARSPEKINQTLLRQTPFGASPWCKGDECTTGSWQPRKPPFTSLNDLKPVYMLPNPDWFWTCDPAPLPNGESRTEEEASIAGVKRQVDAANWVWAPDVGKMKDWDAEEFVIRMLRSPGGLILIGGI